MSDSNDISSLYRQFGGDPGQYQEIGRTNQAIAARERWPLLAAIQPGQGFVPPAVGAEPANSALPRSAWPPAAAIPEPSMLFPAEPEAAPEPAPIETAVDDAQAAEPHVVPARLEPFTAAMAANQANEAAPATLRSVPMDTPKKAVPQSTAQDPGQPSRSLQSVFARLAKPPRNDVHAETGPPLNKLLAKK